MVFTLKPTKKNNETSKHNHVLSIQSYVYTNTRSSHTHLAGMWCCLFGVVRESRLFKKNGILDHAIPRGIFFYMTFLTANHHCYTHIPKKNRGFVLVRPPLQRVALV